MTTNQLPDIASPARTQAILNTYGLQAKKSLGQNFLTDRSVLAGIVTIAEINDQDNVIEIGPGIGGLTEYLARAAKRVLGFEIDSRLVPVLDETLSQYDNIEILNEDILKTNLPAVVAEKFGEHPTGLKLVANLPYYITTPILMSVLQGPVTFETIVVMMQKEVAERLAAEPGTKAYGSLTIAVQYRMNAEVSLIVPRTAFIPSPNVDSAIVKLTARAPREVLPFDEHAFFKLVKGCFTHRRKNLWNNLQSLYGKTPEIREQLTAALTAVNIDPHIRAERLTVEEFIDLINSLHSQQVAKI